MTYILPRAFIVLIGWGITCALVNTVGLKMNLLIAFFAGMFWVLAGVVCFGYMYKLRIEAQDGQRPS